jgi:hypothetical protein
MINTTKMTFELPYEVIDSVTIACLKQLHQTTYETLKNTLVNSDLTATYSFDFDEEIFALVKELKALELILTVLFSEDENSYKSVNSLLKKLNESVYIQEKTYQEVVEANQKLLGINNMLTDELNELKSKISKILY